MFELVLLGMAALVIAAVGAARATSAGIARALGPVSAFGMTAVTAGMSRFEVLGASGLSIEKKVSDEMEPAVLDNTAAPRYRFNKICPPDDLPIDYYVQVDGTKDQVLQLSFRPDAAFTADTSDSTILLRGKQAVLNDAGGWSLIPLALRLGDRITPDGADSTRAHPLGIADDGSIAAGQWGPYLRFAPGPNVKWFFDDYQRADFHNSS